MYTKEDDAMNLDICMRFECKNCKRRLKCFKEEVDYSEYSKNKNSRFKRSRVQSKKKARKKQTKHTKE